MLAKRRTMKPTTIVVILLSFTIGPLAWAQEPPRPNEPNDSAVPEAGLRRDDDAAPKKTEKSSAVVEDVAELAIRDVTVYEDRALVTRRGTATLDGEGRIQTIRVGGLPPNLLETSLRAGVGEANGKVISVSSVVERRREIQDAALRAAEDSRYKASQQIAELNDNDLRLRVRETYLKAYETLLRQAVSERTRGGAQPDVEAWAAALGFVREQRAALLQERRAVAAKRTVLDKQYSVLEAETRRLREPQERSERMAEITIEGRISGAAEIWLSYVMEGAQWRPRYDARYDTTRNQLGITYFGEIRQRTGEEWSDARVVLSTARPSIGSKRPELTPLRLTAERGGKKIVSVGKKSGNDDFAVAGEASSDAAAAPTAPVVEAVATTTRQNATSATFAVPGVATIPSDGRPYKVPITSFDQAVKTQFECVPRLKRFVYLKCTAHNDSSYPMLSGSVDVFRGSGFIGTATLPFVAPQRPFELSLGIEESLKVRRAVTVEEREARSSSKIGPQRYGFDIEVANFSQTAQSVVVLENYPVADVEEITVELDEKTTRPSEHNKKDGILKWHLKIPGGQARTVHLEYTIGG